MNIFVNTAIVLILLCAGPIIFFSLARKFFGMTKEQESECVRRSVLKILLMFGIIFVLPSLFYLVSNFFNEVVRGSMTMNEYSKHIGEFSFQATYNFYTHLFSKLPRM